MGFPLKIRLVLLNNNGAEFFIASRHQDLRAMATISRKTERRVMPGHV
jgi:hypothetical protein